MKQDSSSKGIGKISVILIAILLLLGLGYLGWKLFNQKRVSQPVTEKSAKTVVWQEKGVAVSGEFADADVVDLGDGRYRMYYSVEPEVAGNKLEVYSAISSDGVNWAKEDGIRKEFAVTPSVVKLPDNKWRMYFQNEQEIKSAISSDGLNFTDEPGTRINKSETGFMLDTVVAPTVTELLDKSFLMVYRGVENTPYQTSEKIPSRDTSYLFYATSNNGLTWQKKGLALDSRNDTLYGLTDGPEWALYNNNELRLYFWTYAGVYYLSYENGKFSQEPIFAFQNQKNAGKFPENPPCDPSLVKINNQWFMYYGQHTKGIYYAVLQ